MRTSSPRSTRSEKSSKALEKAAVQAERDIPACSGGMPLASPFSRSSLWAISWTTTLPQSSPSAPSSTSVQERIAGPSGQASPESSRSTSWATPSSSTHSWRATNSSG